MAELGGFMHGWLRSVDEMEKKEAIFEGGPVRMYNINGGLGVGRGQWWEWRWRRISWIEGRRDA